MDLLILIVLIVIVVCAYRDVKFVSYLFGILEIFFRIVHYLGDNIPIINLNPVVNKYFPTSLFSVIDRYTSGIVNDLISWILVIIFILFLYCLIKYFFKKK